MTIKSDEAAAMLKDVESVVARVKQSRIYRSAGLVIMFWGALNLVRGLLIAFWPQVFGSRWFVIDCIGVAGTLVLLGRGTSLTDRGLLRILIAFALFYGFGFLWADVIGGFGPREETAFWPTLFLFGYALAGLWFGAAFSAIGIGLAAVIVAGYFWGGAAFALWQALVTGVGFLLCGLWMRRS